MHKDYLPANSQPQVDEPDEENTWSPLQLAAAKGDLSEVQRLLAHDIVDPNEPPKGYYGKSALQAASSSGNLDVVEALLAAGADVDAPGGNNGAKQPWSWPQVRVMWISFAA